MKKIIGLHITVWIVYVIRHAVNSFDTFPPITTITPYLLFFVLYILHFYSYTELILPRFFKTKRYFLFAIVIIISWVVFQILNFGLILLFSMKYSDGDFVRLLSWKFISSFNGYYLQYLIYAIIYYVIYELLKKKRLLEEKNYNQQLQIQQLEKEKLKFELDFLRAQINPHFLYNTLNSLRGRIIQHDEGAAQCMDDFGKIMRYSISEGDTDGQVNVEDELEQIERLLNIYRFLYNNQTHIRYEEKGQIGGRIPPHILLTLAENAVKHADLQDAAHPLAITVETTDGVNGGDDHLIFTVHNKKAPQTTSGSGIGMSNLRKRLDGFYGTEYTMTVTETPTHYTVQLKVFI